MNVLGIFRGFPGLGRVVSGTAILETLCDVHGCNIDMISYLQGQEFLKMRGYGCCVDATPMDYCSIGLLPTNKMGAYIHSKIKTFKPEVVVVDGEPLMVHSLRTSFPNLKIVVLLNPSDVDNPQNDKEAMEFFNAMYSLADLAVVHGLRDVTNIYNYKRMISTRTILRREIFKISNTPTKNIYCLLGGGTVNVGNQFEESTVCIARLCVESARLLPNYTMHIVCSSSNIYDALNAPTLPNNVVLHERIIDTAEYYSKACLVISRSGRNTLSELAYLGIPSISFVSGCSYRKVEQEQNLKSLNAQNICSAEINCSAEEFAELCKRQMSCGIDHPSFEPGNAMVIDRIINL